MQEVEETSYIYGWCLKKHNDKLLSNFIYILTKMISTSIWLKVYYYIKEFNYLSYQRISNKNIYIYLCMNVNINILRWIYLIKMPYTPC